MSDIAKIVLEKAGSLALDEISSAYAVRSDLDELKKSISVINCALLDDFQEKRGTNHGPRCWLQQETNSVLRYWLQQVKAIFYDAEDVLDEFMVEDLERQVVNAMGFKRKLSHFFSSSNPAIFPFKMAEKLEIIRERLHEAEKDTIKGHGYGPIIHEDRSSHYFVYEPYIMGRARDKDRVLRLLFQPDGGDVSVVPIVGIGGLGKATLAKLVYNHLKEFDLKMGVYVSRDFSLSTVIRRMIESTTDKSRSGLSTELLPKRMEEILKDRTYFLVLDDVWNEDPCKWTELKRLLMKGSKGSKILVTTRSNEVASIMATCDEFKCSLSGLCHEDSMSLFFQHAFMRSDEGQYPELKTIGEEIVRKCKGVPLAIITLGTLLHSTREIEASGRELPNWMKDLHFLQSLDISTCDRLSGRCERGTGKDWPNISHIPHIAVDGVKL